MKTSTTVIDTPSIVAKQSLDLSSLQLSTVNKVKASPANGSPSECGSGILMEDQCVFLPEEAPLPLPTTTQNPENPVGC